MKEISVKGNVGMKELLTGVKSSDILTVHDADMSLHRLAARAQINQWQIEEEGWFQYPSQLQPSHSLTHFVLSPSHNIHTLPPSKSSFPHKFTPLTFPP